MTMVTPSREDSIFKGLLQAAPDGILVCNDRGEIILANEQLERMMGFAPGELLNQPIEALVPDYIRPKHADLRNQYFNSPRRRSMGIGLDLLARRHDGSHVPVEISLSPFQLDGASCAIAVVRDVTEARHLDRELKRSNQELRRSNEELEQFAYVASHDLQEPLRMVSGYTQLLKRRYGDKLDNDAKEYIDFAVDGVKRMQALINDLLTYSRLSTRAKPFTAVALDDVVQSALGLLEITIDEEKATVDAAGLPQVMGDPVQLDQLFQNMISNALKFHGEGRNPHVRISAERQADGWWRVAVADNGIGIEQEYADKIFVIFQRLHSRERYAGTGIGLAICKKVVERHGGKIWFESQLGQGTTFYFTLPAATEDTHEQTGSR